MAKRKKDKGGKNHAATLYDSRALRSTRTTNAVGHMVARGALVAKEGVMAYPAAALPPAVIAELGDSLPRDGMVQVYQSADVLQEAGTDAYDGLPLTTEHPPGGLVTMGDTAHTVGVFTSPTFPKKGVSGNLTIIKPRAVKMVDSKEAVELSLGHRVGLAVESGSFRGKDYQVVKKWIEPNHIAITREGRCGADCVINDCAACGGHTTEEKSMADEKKVVTMVVGDSIVEVTPESKPVVSKVLDDKSTMEAERDTAVNGKAALQQEFDDFKAEHTPEKIAELVAAGAAERAEVTTKAAAVIGDSADFKGKDAQAIKLEALDAAKVKVPEDKKKDTSYVGALFDSLDVKEARGTSAGQMFDSNRNDPDAGKSKKGDEGDEKPDAEKARAAMIARNKKRPTEKA